MATQIPTELESFHQFLTVSVIKIIAGQSANPDQAI